MVRLADLGKRPSRGVCLEQLLPLFLGDSALRAAFETAKSKLGGYSSYANFADPAFMAVHAANVLDPANYTETEAGLEFQFPEKEARHLSRLQQGNAQHTAEANIKARVSLALDDPKWASADFAKEAAEFAARALPNPDEEDFLKSEATSLASIAVLVARDGDDGLLKEFEEWVRAVANEILGWPPDRLAAMRDTLSYNRPALAISALLHLWLRKGLTTDRNLLLGLAAREDRGGAPGFSAAISKIVEKDARLAKSALRIAFGFCRYMHNKWEQIEEQAQAAELLRRNQLDSAVKAEIDWLEGGEEPRWPEFLPEHPSVRRPFRIGGRTLETVEQPDIHDDDREEDEFSEFTDSQMAAAWLKAVGSGSHPVITKWLPDIVAQYAQWTAIANGLGLDAGDDLDHLPSEWNYQFFQLVARVMMEGTPARFDQLMSLLNGLPDSSFARTADIVLHASDVWYFNQPEHSAERPKQLRERIGQRLAACEFWQRERRRGDLSISFDNGPLLANFFMNTHNPFARTASYLVEPIFDRIDPLLETLLPFIGGGPTAIVAHFTMNTLALKPEPRHLEFIVSATEIWLERCPGDAGVWLELGLGRRVVLWLDVAADKDSSILAAAHEHRFRIDRIVGRFIELGVAEAHDLERKIALAKQSR